MTQKAMIKVAKQEFEAWDNPKMPRGLVMIILFAFIHRVTTGETIEESFLQPKLPNPDYEI